MKCAVVGILAAMFVAPLLAGTASAADVNQTLYALNTAWHVGSNTSASTTITIQPGDTLHLTVINDDDGTLHSFVLPRFNIFHNLSTVGGSSWSVDIPTTSAHAGTWQFWCFQHSGGSDPEQHTGMVGSLVIQTAAPPRTPGFEALAAIGALATAFIAVTVWRRK